MKCLIKTYLRLKAAAALLSALPGETVQTEIEDEPSADPYYGFRSAFASTEPSGQRRWYLNQNAILAMLSDNGLLMASLSISGSYLVALEPNLWPLWRWRSDANRVAAGQMALSHLICLRLLI